MSANEDDELCDLFERLVDLKTPKTAFLRLGLSQAQEEEEKTLTTSLPEILSGMYSADLTRILMATKSLQRMLTRESNLSKDEIIEAGLLTPLVTFLGCDYDGEHLIQDEAVWALTTIASGTSQQRHAVVQAGAVPQLIRLLASPHVAIVHDCVWTLGKIISDEAELRDFVIESGILPPLMRLVDVNAPPDFLGTVAWVISTLCRNNKSPPKLEAINACLLPLRMLIRHTDYDVLSYTCYALYWVVNCSRDLIRVVTSPDILPRLVELLGTPEPLVIIPALQTIAKIIDVDESQLQTVIDTKVLQMLPAFLQHTNVDIKKLACWLLANIARGSPEQIQAVINCNLLPLVVEVLNTGDVKSQRQAVWVIIGLTKRGTLEHIIYVVQCGALKSLCDLLTTKEATLLYDVLHGIFSVLKATNKFGQAEYLYVMLKEIGGLDKIEKLENHQNYGVKYKAYNIIHKFLSR